MSIFLKSAIFAAIFFGTSGIFAQANTKVEDKESETSLREAFQQEYALLQAQKRTLEAQIKTQQTLQADSTKKAQDDISQLELEHMQFTNQLEKENERLEAIQTANENATDASEMLANTLIQAQDSLKKYSHVIELKTSDATGAAEASSGSAVEEVSKISPNDQAQKISKLVGSATEILGKVQTVRTVDGPFYLNDGSKDQGKIVYVGNIAAFAISDKYQGTLSPAGGGKLKAVKADSKASAEGLAKSEAPEQVKAYFFESPYAEAVDQVEKTWLQTLDDGGKVAWLIFYLGMFTLLMSIVRFFILHRSSRSSKYLTKSIGQLVSAGKVQEALKQCESQSNVTAKVLEKTLSNIEKNRIQVEDIVTETVIHESRLIDRFGNFIIITSTVAPLLGLLGTVAGMIVTFNTLTEFGSGNPKLLSGGISEALICTMMGLIVAIPALLAGSLMNGWADKIKDDMVHAALHITNLFQSRKVKDQVS